MAKSGSGWRIGGRHVKPGWSKGAKGGGFFYRGGGKWQKVAGSGKAVVTTWQSGFPAFLMISAAP